MEFLGKKLKYLRELKGYSLTSVVYLLNEKFNRSTTKSTLSKYENGSLTPKLDTILFFSRLYGVSCDYLLDDSIQDTNFQGGFFSVSYVNIKFMLAKKEFKFDILSKQIPVSFKLNDKIEYFAVSVNDDSMEPFLYSGDAVVCSKCSIEDVVEDSLYAVYIHKYKKTYIRRVFKKNDLIFFKPDNILYHLDWQRVNSNEPTNVSVLGKVLETHHLM